MLFGVFALLTVFLLLELTFTGLLALLFLEVADESLPGDGLALEALPDSVWHTFEVSAEKVVWFFTAAAVDKVAGILALKTVVGVLVAFRREHVSIIANERSRTIRHCRN